MKSLAIVAVAAAAMVAPTAHAGQWVKVPVYKDVKVCSDSSSDAGDVLAGALLGGIIGNNIGNGNGNGAAGAIIGGLIASESGKKCHWERQEYGHRWVHVD